MNTFLITGVTGYLGSRLAMELLGTHARVIGLKRRTSSMARLNGAGPNLVCHNIETADLNAIVEEAQVDTILHAATCYGRHGESMTDIVDANVRLPLRLLDLAIAHRIPRFVNIDTAAEGILNAYALSKKQFRTWLSRCTDRLCAVNLVLEHFYGPGDDPSKFVTWLIRQLLCDQSIDLTAGEQVRNFIFIDDVVAAVTAVLSHHSSDQLGAFDYHIGHDDPSTIRHVVETAHRCADSHSVLNFGAMPYRPNEIMASSPVDSTAMAALHWAPATSLTAGLAITVAAERDLMAEDIP